MHLKILYNSNEYKLLLKFSKQNFIKMSDLLTFKKITFNLK